MFPACDADGFVVMSSVNRSHQCQNVVISFCQSLTPMSECCDVFLSIAHINV